MAIRIAPDKDRPSVAIEIPLEKSLPDYDLEQVEQPTPRDIDGVLVTQGFRDLVDDARGILTELVSRDDAHFEIAQLTGAICPGEEEVYRPGLWIVLKDTKAGARQALSELALEHARRITEQLVQRLGL